jgi:glucose/arabinose dehydrogenase
VLTALFVTPLSAQITFTDTGFANEKVASGFSSPTGFVFAPDGRIFVWEKAGRVKIFKNGALLSTPFVDISGHVNTSGDRGLLGLALDPNFSTNGYVYLAYVYENGGDPTSTAARTERVTRVQADPNNKDRALAGETVILGTKSTLPCNSGEDCLEDDVNTHTVDHLLFGPDGKLYVSAGDGGDWRSATVGSLRAQNLDSLNGKVLRINPDGSAPGDNPFDNGTNSPHSKVYDYGLRNPFRYSFGPNNELIIGDVGWATYEEIDIGRGKNFGWPCYEGAFPQPSFQSAYTQCQNLAASSVAMPNYYYHHVTNIGGSIIMGPYLQASPYPAQYENQLYFADFSNKWLKRATLDSTGKITNVTSFATALNQPVFLSKGPDGNLYWLAIGSGTIYRIRYTGSANRPPTAVANATPANGLSPLQVSFSSAGSSDPDNNTMTYLWDFGDGSAISTSPNPIHTYSGTGVLKFTAKLTVTDTSNATGSASVLITLGSTSPQVTISAPANNVTVNPGAVVNFSGSANDAEDGNIPVTSLLWTEILHHNTHTHLIKQVTGSSGSFTADLPDTIDAYWYELTLKATDSSGVSTTKSVRININYVQGSGSPCTLKTTDPSVTICTPAPNATVSSPVHIVAGSTNSAGVTNMKIYIDGVAKYSINSNKVDTSLALPTGTHRVTVQTFDKLSRYVHQTEYITVGTTTGCTTKTADPSITICSPTAGSTVKSPVHVVASTTDSAGVTALDIYVDNALAYKSTANKVDTMLTMATGSHTIVVQIWDKAGRILKQPVTFTVSP